MAPYAAATIGNTFGHNGSEPNQAAQLLSHAILGATLAYVNGGNAGSGAVAAAGSEAAALYLTQTLYKDQATDENGVFDPNRLPESVIIGKDVAQASKAANQAARDLNNITRNPATTGTKIHRNTGVLLGEANGKASKLSNSTSSYFKGANKSTGLQPDMSWKGTGVWSDLTTQGQWNSHVTKYNKQFGTTGIGIIYVPEKGVTNTLKLNSGAGVTINGVRQLGNTSEKEK